MTRLDHLKQYAIDNPEDPFSLYGLALEYAQTYPSKTLNLLAEAKSKFPDYLPTYYTFATRLFDIEEYVEALKIVKEGIDLAQTQLNAKTVRELQSLATMINITMLEADAPE